MTKRRDSDKDISDKLNKLIWESEKQAKRALIRFGYFKRVY